MVKLCFVRQGQALDGIPASVGWAEQSLIYIKIRFRKSAGMQLGFRHVRTRPRMAGKGLF